MNDGCVMHACMRDQLRALSKIMTNHSRGLGWTTSASLRNGVPNVCLCYAARLTIYLVVRIGREYCPSWERYQESLHQISIDCSFSRTSLERPTPPRLLTLENDICELILSAALPTHANVLTALMVMGVFGSPHRCRKGVHAARLLVVEMRSAATAKPTDE